MSSMKAEASRARAGTDELGSAPGTPFLMAVVNGQYDLCDWLLDQFDNNPSNACNEIEQRLGIAADGETQCEQVLDTLCDSARRASVGNCYSCVSSHQSQVDAANCAGTAAEEFCGNGH